VGDYFASGLFSCAKNLLKRAKLWAVAAIGRELALVVLVEYAAQRPGEAGEPSPGSLTPLVGFGDQGVTGQPLPNETPVAHDIICT
jgi:hypothetical protein